MHFTTQFNDFAVIGDSVSVTVNGVEFTATLHADTDCGIDDDDSHNTDVTVTGCDSEQQAALMAAREAYFRDDWFYGGIILSTPGDEHAGSLWGIEVNYPGSDNAYLRDVANQLLEEYLA